MKSEVTVQLEIMRAVYTDACMKCTDVVSDSRDLEYIEARVKREGLSFLTITLPEFSVDFERSLAESRVAPAYFRRFRKHGAIPAFLQGMLGRLFDRETGRKNDFEADHPRLVAAVRQICCLFKRVELECSPARRAKALANYVSVELLNSVYLPPDPSDTLYRVGDLLWGNMFSDYKSADLVPRHGPGAVVEGYRGNAKWLPTTWYESVERFLPFWGNVYSVHGAFSPELEGKPDGLLYDVPFVPIGAEEPVKVIFVPKTLKSPRVIAIEPSCMQYAQQAIRSYLYTKIEEHPLSAGRINFRDQSINQRMALQASSTEQWATIDLSDASDRVPLVVVTEMLRCCPELRDDILACRSSKALLPNGRVVPELSKFASMGSALCFPIEAMYFYAICIVALIEKRGLPVNLRTLRNVSADVRVYGDDLIVPTSDAVTVVEYLQKYNCKVNANKSFWTGMFRESCGVDAYAGQEVTPLYLRHLPPNDRQTPQPILSWVSTANAFKKRGYEHTAHLMYRTVESILGPLPEVSESSGVVGRVVDKPRIERKKGSWRYNPRYQACEIKAWVPSPVYREDHLDDYPALQKCLLALENRPKRARTLQRDNLKVPWTAGSGWLDDWLEISPSDKRHLERSVVRGGLTLKLRWVDPT